MEEKQPVVIQGRTINRERPREPRPIHSYSRSVSTNRVGTNSDTYSTSLASLRESRRAERGGASSLPPVDRLRIRPRMRRASYPYSRRQGAEDGLQLNSQMLKIAISVLIALLILLINSIKLPFTQAIIGHVRAALTHEFDLDEALGKLKFVGESIPGGIREVFGQNPENQETNDDQESFRSPVKGEVAKVFGEQVALGSQFYENQGIDILTAPNAPVYAAADGIVAAVEEHETYGTSIWVDHGNKVFSFYGRCGQVLVKAGQKVKQGEKLAVVETPAEGDPMLHFQIWVNNKAEDPLDHIGQPAGSFNRRSVQPA